MFPLSCSSEFSYFGEKLTGIQVVWLAAATMYNSGNRFEMVICESFFDKCHDCNHIFWKKYTVAECVQFLENVKIDIEISYYTVKSRVRWLFHGLRKLMLLALHPTVGSFNRNEYIFTITNVTHLSRVNLILMWFYGWYAKKAGLELKNPPVNMQYVLWLNIKRHYKLQLDSIAKISRVRWKLLWIWVFDYLWSDHKNDRRLLISLDFTL